MGIPLMRSSAYKGNILLLNMRAFANDKGV